MSNEFVEKDSKLGYIICIIILFILVLGLSGYIVYDNFIVADKEEVEIKEEVEKVDFELDAKKVEKLVEKAKVYNKFLYQYYLVNPGEDIPNDVALFFAYRILLMDNKTITVENVSDVLEEYFGKNHEFEIDDIKCLAGHDEVMYEYDEENNIYVDKEHGGHGGGVAVASYVKVVSYSVDKNKVKLITKVLYPTACSDTCGPANEYYADVQDMFEGKNPVIENPNPEEELVLTDDLFDSATDMILNTTYHFVLEDNGNLYLDKVVRSA